MRIETTDMRTIEQLALSADLSSFKQLNQGERRAVQAMMSALQKGESSVEIKGFSEKKIRAIQAKLQLRVQKSPSSTVERIGKGIGNVLRLRVSSGKMKQEFEDRSAKYARLQDIPKRIKHLEDKIEELVAVIKWNSEFTSPVYAQQAKFCQELSDDFSQSKVMIAQRKGEIEQQIAVLRSSKDPDKMDKIKALEKEVLKSLQKMEKYNGSDWPKELKSQRIAWSNSADKSLSMPREAIEDNQKMLASLTKEQVKLEKELGLGKPKRMAAIDKQIEAHRNLVAKAKVRISLLREVRITLGEEHYNVWSRIARGASYTHIIEENLAKVEAKILELKGKNEPIDKAKLKELNKFRADLEVARDIDPGNRKLLADNEMQRLGNERDKAQDKIGSLHSAIFRRELALEELNAKKGGVRSS